MKKLLILAFASLACPAFASNAYNNSPILDSVQVSTGVAVLPIRQSPYNVVVDLASADSASWQMTATCAKGQLKIQQSNDGTNFVDLNVAGSSITFASAGLTTTSNQLYAIANPAYRYVNFVVSNTSAPVAGVASNCTVTVRQLLKSLTPRVN